MRLVPYLMAVGLLAIRFRGPPARTMAQVLAVVGLLFFATRTIANTISLGMAADDQSAKLEAIDLMPRGARVISLVGMTCQEYWPLLRNGHLGAMVIVRRDGFSNDQWLLEGVESARPQISRGGLLCRRPVAARAPQPLPRPAAPHGRQFADAASRAPISTMSG